MSERKPWRLSKGWGFVVGLVGALSLYANFVLPQRQDYFCYYPGGNPSRWSIWALLLLWLVSLGVAVWRLVVHDKAGFAWLAVSAASMFLIVWMAVRSVCNS